MRPDKLCYINPAAGVPSPAMNNETWQQCFQLLRKLIFSSRCRRMQGDTAAFPINGEAVTGTDGEESIYTYRKTYVNDILSRIRKGDVEYVYHIYNISELLRYEHEKLRTYYNQKDQFFEVWLDK